MVNYEAWMREVLKCSAIDRINLGKHALYDTMVVLARNGLTITDSVKFIISLIRLFVTADNVCSDDEYNLIRAITEVDFSKKRFFEITDIYAKEGYVDEIDKVIEKLPLEQKKPICLFGLSILASDNVLTNEEEKLFIRLSK